MEMEMMEDLRRTLEWRFLTIAPCDAAEPWQLGSQDAATPIMQGIIDLHHDILFFLILILVFVSRILVRALWHFHEQTNPIPQRIVHGTTIEIIRTIFPSIIPMFIAIPSFALLYSMDEAKCYAVPGAMVGDPTITIEFLLSDSMSPDSLVDLISNASTSWVIESGRQIPPEWGMPELVRNVISDDRLEILRDTYFDVIYNGTASWFYHDIMDFIDLIIQ